MIKIRVIIYIFIFAYLCLANSSCQFSPKTDLDINQSDSTVNEYNQEQNPEKRSILHVYGVSHLSGNRDQIWVYCIKEVKRDIQTDILQKGFHNLCKKHFDGKGDEIILSKEVNPDFLTISDGWIYFRDPKWIKDPVGPLKRIKLDGSGLMEITKEDVEDWYIYQDWIFYTTPYKGVLMRIKKDGTDKIQYINKAGVNWFFIVEDNIYATIFDKGGIGRYGHDPSEPYPLYKMLITDNPKPIKIVDDAMPFQIRGEWVYYLSDDSLEIHEKNSLFRTSLDGKITEKLTENNVSDFLITSQGYAFYLEYKNNRLEDPKNLYRIDLQSLKREKVMISSLFNLNYLEAEVRDGILISTFDDSSNDFEFSSTLYYFIQIDKTKKQIEFPEDPMMIIGDYIYFMITNPKTLLDDHLEVRKLDEFFSYD